MTGFDQVTTWFFDPTRRFSHKAMLTLCVVLLVCLINDTIGFTAYYRAEKKTAALERLTKIINDTTADPVAVCHAIELRDEVMQERPYFSLFVSFLKNSNLSKSTNNTANMNAAKSNNTNAVPTASMGKNDFVFMLTASGVYCIFALLSIPMAIFGSKGESFFQKLTSAATMIFSFSIVGWLLLSTLYMVPKISSSWIWNYLLNLVVQACSVAFFIFYMKRNDRKAYSAQ